MLAIPRSLARSFPAVVRRCLLGPGARPDWPLVLARADGQALTLQACGGAVCVRHTVPAPQPPAALGFRASVLTEFEGRNEAPVTLEEVAPGRALARWGAAGAPRVLDFDAVTPDSVPRPPDVPARLSALPEGFVAALGEAARTAAREATRFAVTRVQLRGQSGEVVATDGRQLLLQGGFPLPWQDAILVPRLPLLDVPGLAFTGPVALARGDSAVLLHAGAWSFWLAIDATARFPTAEDAIPRGTGAASRLRLAPGDAAFLAATLPRLPGRDDEFGPVTLDLGSPPAVRARSAGGGQAAEAVLARSSVVGPAVRVATDRRYLLRVAQLRLPEVQVTRPDVPLLSRDERTTYVWMPLDNKAVVPPGKDVLRLVSAAGAPAPPESPPSPPRRRTAMPAPPPNGRPPEGRPPPGPPGPNAGIDELIAGAEALRGLLAEAAARSQRLAAALKQHRRQARAVRAAVASLRGLGLDG